MNVSGEIVPNRVMSVGLRGCCNSLMLEERSTTTTGWRLGVVVGVVGRINEVNQHRARLVHDG